jgi:DNA-binding transcriptional ArsR family regulator
MDRDKEFQFEQRAMIMKALAHKSRLYIVSMLENGEKNVQEMTTELEVDMSTVSRHLSVLKNAGIIVAEKRKNQIFYTLKTRCVLGFFQCVENVIQNKDEPPSCCTPMGYL